MPASADLSISIHLVDHETARSLQVWSFDGSTPITIGRGDDRSIVLADPYISRNHAELEPHQGSWRLIARGRNGIFVAGKNVAECSLEHGTEFRLGAAGPLFRFDRAAASSPQATLSFDPSAMVVLQINRQELEAQTQQVVESDFFQRLRDKAREMRGQHLPSDRTERGRAP
jgi:pSer/pThr/pTyr-binding forkhead associated (FHA) protein